LIKCGTFKRYGRMEYNLKYGIFDLTREDFKETLQIIRDILPFDVSQYLVDFTESTGYMGNIARIYNELQLKSELYQYQPTLVEEICDRLDQIITILETHDIGSTVELCHLRLGWKPNSIFTWYLLGRLQYQRFVRREVRISDDIFNIFHRVIDEVESQRTSFDLGFWAYSYLANLYLYRILSGEEALELAMKNYNQAYRFSQEYELGVDEEFIFEDLNILYNIISNKFPLLVLIYNDSGVSLFEYLFQFVEVIHQEKRFIPNFTALLSVLDDRIKELFNAPITNAHLIIENRLMVMTKLFDYNQDKWIKVAFIFSHLQHTAEDIDINQSLLRRIKKFRDQIVTDESLKNYLMNFNGRHEPKSIENIERLLHAIFATDSDQ